MRNVVRARDDELESEFRGGSEVAVCTTETEGADDGLITSSPRPIPFSLSLLIKRIILFSHRP